MRRLAISATLAIIALFAAAARGDLVQEGNLRVAFDGSIVPRVLPRARPAPVTVHLDSSIGTVDGSRPPQLGKVSIAVNRTGHIFVAGLPICARGELEQTSTAAALALCRGALVGHGTFDAAVQFTSGGPIPVNGKALVFNSRIGGKAALLLHIYNSSPVRLAFVVPFTITRPRDGDFGTVFSARIPHIASDRGYVTAIRLTLKRRYAFRGERRSVFSASCSAAPGFPGAVFTLARATFSFENGKRLTSALTRDCAVRQPD
jgi:hypothetical protein